MDLFKENKKWFISDIFKIVKTSPVFLKSNKDARIDIEIFLCSILKCNRVDLYLRYKDSLKKTQLDILKSYINRRNRNEPVQYIVQNTNFYGRNFFV